MRLFRFGKIPGRPDGKAPAFSGPGPENKAYTKIVKEGKKMNNRSSAIRAAVGACIALFANMGMNSVFGLFLLDYLTEWPGVPAQKIALAATLGCAMAFVCATFLVGPVLKKVSPKALFLCCAVIGVIYCGMNYLAANEWWIIAAGLFGGIVLAFGIHAVGVAAISPYFGVYGKKTPTVIGVLFACVALGAAAFSFIPGIFKPILGGWRPVFIVIGAIVVVCNLAAFFIIPKAEKQAAAAGADAGAEAPGLTMKQILRSPSFYLVFIGVICLTIMYQGLTIYMPTFLKVCGLAEASANSMQGIMQLVGIVFILAGGFLTNKLGTKGLLLFAVLPLAAGLLLYAFVFPNVATVWFAIICSVLAVSGGVVANEIAALTPELFGLKSMNQVNSIYTGGATWGGAALASQVVGAFIGQGTAPADYSKGFIAAAIVGGIGTAAMFLAIALNPSKKKQ